MGLEHGLHIITVQTIAHRGGLLQKIHALLVLKDHRQQGRFLQKSMPYLFLKAIAHRGRFLQKSMPYLFLKTIANGVGSYKNPCLTCS